MAYLPKCLSWSRLNHILNVNHYSTYSQRNENLAKITVPHKMQLKILRIKAKASAKRHQEKRHYKTPVMISCNRPKFNHHRGQTYSNFSPQHLASGGWKHNKSVGDHFTLQAISGNPSLVNPENAVNFGSLKISSPICDILQKQSITQATVVQEMMIPLMMQGKNVLCAAETGSGKTLAFLLPILESITYQFRKKLLNPGELNRPLAVILAASRELAEQIYGVAKILGADLNCQPHLVVGGRGTQKLLRKPQATRSDILIATPGVLIKLLTKKVYDTSHLSHIVIDEADTLLDDSFSPLTIRLLQKLKVTSEQLVMRDNEVVTAGTQLALVGATMPRGLEELMGEIVPLSTTASVTTPHLHRLMPHVAQKFIRISRKDKTGEVVGTLRSNCKRGIATIVFCARSSTVCYLGYILEDMGVPHVMVHANMTEKNRQGRFLQFQTGEQDVLLCTDVCSRGLDTLRAQHVINYDFPTFMSDYIHRVGRVGRVGSQGSPCAISYITHKWDVELLWKIETAARSVSELYNVNANIKRKLNAIHENKQLQESEHSTTE